MRRNTWETVQAIGACILVLVVVMGVMWLKMEAYGGDAACLVVHCVKVVK